MAFTGERLMQGIDSYVSKAISRLSYNTTELCAVSKVNDDGSYQVTNGTVSFKAWGGNEKYAQNDSVYVLVPNGTHDAECMILRKKTTDQDIKVQRESPKDNIAIIGDNLIDMWHPISLDSQGETTENDVTIEDRGLRRDDFTRHRLDRLYIKFKSYAETGRNAVSPSSVLSQGSYTIQFKVEIEGGQTIVFDIPSEELEGNLFASKEAATYQEECWGINYDRIFQAMLFENPDLYQDVATGEIKRRSSTGGTEGTVPAINLIPTGFSYDIVYGSGVDVYGNAVSNINSGSTAITINVELEEIYFGIDPNSFEGTQIDIWWTDDKGNIITKEPYTAKDWTEVDGNISKWYAQACIYYKDPETGAVTRIGNEQEILDFQKEIQLKWYINDSTMYKVTDDPTSEAGWLLLENEIGESGTLLDFAFTPRKNLVYYLRTLQLRAAVYIDKIAQKEYSNVLSVNNDDYNLRKYYSMKDSFYIRANDNYNGVFNVYNIDNTLLQDFDNSTKELLLYYNNINILDWCIENLNVNEEIELKWTISDNTAIIVNSLPLYVIKKKNISNEYKNCFSFYQNNTEISLQNMTNKQILDLVVFQYKLKSILSSLSSNSVRVNCEIASNTNKKVNIKTSFLINLGIINSNIYGLDFFIMPVIKNGETYIQDSRNYLSTNHDQLTLKTVLKKEGKEIKVENPNDLSWSWYTNNRDFMDFINNIVDIKPSVENNCFVVRENQVQRPIMFNWEKNFYIYNTIEEDFQHISNSDLSKIIMENKDEDDKTYKFNCSIESKEGITQLEVPSSNEEISFNQDENSLIFQSESIAENITIKDNKYNPSSLLDINDPIYYIELNDDTVKDGNIIPWPDVITEEDKVYKQINLQKYNFILNNIAERDYYNFTFCDKRIRSPIDIKKKDKIVFIQLDYSRSVIESMVYLGNDEEDKRKIVKDTQDESKIFIQLLKENTLQKFDSKIFNPSKDKIYLTVEGLDNETSIPFEQNYVNLKSIKLFTFDFDVADDLDIVKINAKLKNDEQYEDIKQENNKGIGLLSYIYNDTGYIADESSSLDKIHSITFGINFFENYSVNTPIYTSSLSVRNGSCRSIQNFNEFKICLLNKISLENSIDNSNDNNEQDNLIANIGIVNVDNYRNNYGILQADLKYEKQILTAYFPIAYTSNESLSIQGNNIIYYDSSSNLPFSQYDSPVYSLLENNNIIDLDNSETKLFTTEKAEDKLLTFSPPEIILRRTLSSENYNQVKLKPPAFFDENFKSICLVLYHDENNYYSQPILLIKNTYPSQMVSKWDQSLKLDDETGTVFSTALISGTKNNKNQFTGIMLGEIQGITDQSLKYPGLYGYNQGSQTFGLLTSGEAFFGKESGRISFNDGGELASIKLSGNTVVAEWNLTQGEFKTSTLEVNTKATINNINFINSNIYYAEEQGSNFIFQKINLNTSSISNIFINSMKTLNGSTTAYNLKTFENEMNKNNPNYLNPNDDQILNFMDNVNPPNQFIVSKTGTMYSKQIGFDKGKGNNLILKKINDLDINNYLINKLRFNNILLIQFVDAYYGSLDEYVCEYFYVDVGVGALHQIKKKDFIYPSNKLFRKLLEKFDEEFMKASGNRNVQARVSGYIYMPTNSTWINVNYTEITKALKLTSDIATTKLKFYTDGNQAGSIYIDD